MAGRVVIVCDVNGSFGLIEFPADDPDRALRFWSGLLGVELAERSQAQDRGWQSHGGLLRSAFTNVVPVRATRPRCRTSPS
jgi:catechol 2,3-dioxygenase-like lactoylglutathione lyase family enzyme